MLYKLFTELGTNDKMWLAIKDLHMNVKARVLHSGSLSRMFDISQGTGRILAPFMYKVYILNGPLNVLSNHCYAVFMFNGLSLSSPSFADDISLITLHASFLQSLVTKCLRYEI